MKKNFIRLNINDNYLSFGNFFRILKEESNNSVFGKAKRKIKNMLAKKKGDK